MRAADAFLEVRAGPLRYGLPVEHVEEVADLGEVLPVLRRARAMRGFTALHGRLLPLVHLGALVQGGEPPAQVGGTVVVARLGRRHVALEVEAAEAVRREAVTAADVRRLPWARGVARGPEGLVPVLDLAAFESALEGDGPSVGE